MPGFGFAVAAATLIGQMLGKGDHEGARGFGWRAIWTGTLTMSLIGVLLFHTLFIVSPQAGQNIFDNAALGEYFRTFVAYGTIAFALVMTTRAPGR